MKKGIYFFIITALLLSACAKDEVVKEQPVQQTKYMLLKADIKESSSQKTKLATTENVTNKYVCVNWEEGDVINLLFVQQSGSVTNKAKALATINAVDNSTGSASFAPVAVPSGIIDTNAPFDLYATVGGLGLDDTDITKFKMKTDLGIGRLSASDLKDDVALVAHTPNIQLSEITGNVALSFRHLGSLFYVYVMNISSGNQSLTFNMFTITGLNVGTETNWMYYPTAQYDLVNDEFVAAPSTTSATGFDPLKISTATFSSGSSYTIPADGSAGFWQWIPPVKETSIDKLKLAFYSGNVSETEQEYVINNLQPAKRYDLNLVYDKGTITVVQLCVIRFHAPTGHYNKTIKVKQLSNNPRFAWVDLNQNNIRETGELVTNNGWGTNSFDIPSSGYLDVVGPVAEIDFANIGITKLELLGNPPVYKIDLSNNAVSYTEMVNLVKQLPDRSSMSPAGTLIVTGNTPAFSAQEQSDLRALVDANGKTAADKSWTITF